MELIDGLMVKQFEDHKKHFEARLFERYGISLMEGEYETLCEIGQFQGVVSKSSNKTVGTINIRGRKVFVLYTSHLKCFCTCYPPDVETDLYSALRACFGSTIRKIAVSIYMEYLNECKSLPTFESQKDAAVYLFSNTMFPQMHIEKYKTGNINTLKFMNQINKIINGDHSHVKISLIKRDTPMY